MERQAGGIDVMVQGECCFLTATYLSYISSFSSPFCWNESFACLTCIPGLFAAVACSLSHEDRARQRPHDLGLTLLLQRFYAAASDRLGCNNAVHVDNIVENTLNKSASKVLVQLSTQQTLN
jgi:hypothetical protein